jgi:hypothetical protein
MPQHYYQLSNIRFFAGIPGYFWVANRASGFVHFKNIVMKTLRFILLILVVVYGEASAQAISGHMFRIEGADTAVADDMLLNAPLASRVPVRAARDFEKHYEGMLVRWFQYGDTTVARFTADSATTFVGYGKSGHRIYTVKCFSEKFLPAAVRHDIRSQYYDYRINLVYQVRTGPNRPLVYIVYASDDQHNLKVIRWSEEGVELMKDIKRQKG